MRQNPLDNFVKIIGLATPPAYLAVGWIFEAWWVGLIGFIYALILHIAVIYPLANMSNIGINKCPAKSFGRPFSRAFIARVIFGHLIALALIYSQSTGWWVFIPVVLVYFFLDYVLSKKYLPDLSTDRVDFRIK